MGHTIFLHNSYTTKLTGKEEVDVSVDAQTVADRLGLQDLKLLSAETTIPTTIKKITQNLISNPVQA